MMTNRRSPSDADVDLPVGALRGRRDGPCERRAGCRSCGPAGCPYPWGARPAARRCRPARRAQAMTVPSPPLTKTISSALVQRRPACPCRGPRRSSPTTADRENRWPAGLRRSRAWPCRVGRLAGVEDDGAAPRSRAHAVPRREAAGRSRRSASPPCRYGASGPRTRSRAPKRIRPSPMQRQDGPAAALADDLAQRLVETLGLVGIERSWRRRGRTSRSWRTRRRVRWCRPPRGARRPCGCAGPSRRASCAS